MQELKDKLKHIAGEIDKAEGFIDLPGMEKKIAELQASTMDENFWGDQKRAQKVTTELDHLSKKKELWEGMRARCEELTELLEIYFEEHDDSDKDRAQLHSDVESLEKDLKSASVELFMSGEFDSGNTILSIYSGAGGVDAQDWVSILLRMYLRYAEKKSFKTTILQKTDGEPEGVKHVTILIEGPLAYGFLKEEKGVHRLVRLSPFNSGNTRETSFALVEVVPEIDTDVEGIEINEKDLRVDTFRASGAGGQHVNTSDSAVRITHAPTGIVVSCQNERSQHQNKDRAMAQLRGKLAALKHEQAVEKIEDLKGDLGKNEWGHQIRSYVMHPYKMVKDLRTKWETSQIDNVLDGDLDDVIEAGLLAKDS
ncbi:peptide chain release factor 2 [Candidatus Peregrinibacteria bacterium]|nr:peptide chain release factor 2 [Candidatus Peregrinibacteria bacterium]